MTKLFADDVKLRDQKNETVLSRDRMNQSQATAEIVYRDLAAGTIHVIPFFFTDRANFNIWQLGFLSDMFKVFGLSWLVGDSIKRPWCARCLSNESFHCWNRLFGEASLS